MNKDQSTGFLLVDLASSVSFHALVPATGKIDWGFSLATGQGIYLQDVSFRLVPVGGTFSNRLD